MYFASLCYVCELALALTNTWMFLIRQRKYKTRPLLMFYILTIALAAIRIYGSLFEFYVRSTHEIFGSLLAAILKLNIGAIQCWILFELGIRVNMNIKMTEKLNERQFDSKQSHRMNKWIMCG